MVTEPSSDAHSDEIDTKVRNAEWARFCLRHRAVKETIEFVEARVELPQIDGATELRIAASFSGSKQMSCTLFFVPPGEIDPLPITFHHNWAIASLREGHCLLVPISDDMEWTHNVWPTSIEELNAFIANLTDFPGLLEAWIMERSREYNKLLMVVVTQRNVCCGYLLGRPEDCGIQ